MAVLSCKCTNCGADLQLSSETGLTICKFCGGHMQIQSAPNMLGVHEQDRVLADSSKNIIEELKRAETFLDLNKNDMANLIFIELSQRYPYDYRGWWGVCRTSSTKLNRNQDVCYVSKVAYDNAQ